ncbi:MAG: ABC transporter substrate-binding protein [Thermodesulfobacteriota bacterium]|nr:ABC transporter substrate-binding protein [Thermodesulfobacteriota bacterium]
MKRIVYLMVLLLVMGVTMPCLANADKEYRIDVLQVADIEPFQDSYKGFIEGLAENGIVEGKNLTVNKCIIDADPEAGLWKKIGILLRIKKAASKIAGSRPDLVLTIGTPATKYSKNKIIKAGIPLVFTAVAIPEAAGCESLTHAGPGFTGTTLYFDPLKVLKISKMALPNMKTLGVIHSDDDNAIAFANEAKEKAGALGITVITKEVDKSDSIKPAAMEMIEQGVDAFGIPIDTYYGLRDYEPVHELIGIRDDPAIRDVPVISFVYKGIPGAILYAGADFRVLGKLSGGQASKILKEGVKPEDLPVLQQKEFGILVDLENAKLYGVKLPIEILQIAKPIE